MTLGEKLSRLRKEQNYTQEQLADLLGVSRQSISKWESNVAYPETEKLIELGKLFGCSMDYLLKDEITEKNGITEPDAVAGWHAIREKISTEQNRQLLRKILKAAGIVLAVMVAADVVSLALYFLIFGIP